MGFGGLGVAIAIYGCSLDRMYMAIPPTWMATFSQFVILLQACLYYYLAVSACICMSTVIFHYGDMFSLYS